MKNYFLKFVNKLTSIGGSLQTPIAILPAAGLLLALGTIFTNPAFVEMIPLRKSDLCQYLRRAASTGNIIFANLPLIFCGRGCDWFNK